MPGTFSSEIKRTESLLGPCKLLCTDESTVTFQVIFTSFIKTNVDRMHKFTECFYLPSISYQLDDSKASKTEVKCDRSRILTPKLLYIFPLFLVAHHS